ncbi:MAG: GGDEF protein [Magnetococcales bacterium]|nr:GGDEF protein [Magnetococcales bacterium]HIJ83577.1 GGDEF domain-containing protein [Magnetococcales bacterium]
MTIDKSEDILGKLDVIMSRLDACESRFSGLGGCCSSLNERFNTLIGIKDVEYLEFMERLALSGKKLEQLENELERSRSITSALTSCNQALAYADTEEKFLSQVCDFIVKSGGFCMVWIGYALDDERKTIQAMASSGFDRSYVEKLDLTWDDSPQGQGPTGRSIRNKKPELSRNITTDENFAPWRSEAVKRGYASSLSLPLILANDVVLGALNLYSREIDYFSDDEIHILFTMARDIAFGIQSQRDLKKSRESAVKNQRDYKSRIAISALLETSLQAISLRQQLEAAMDLIISVPWLTIEPKGSIFLADEVNKKLDLTVQRNLSPPLLGLCKRIDYGYCLCGRAAKERKVIFASCLDHNHDVTFDGIKPHGHFCIPIESLGKLLGVLNLYVAHGHERDDDEQYFLVTFANTLAGIIERKRAEEKISLMARTDSLTQLPNRASILERLNHDILRAKRQNEVLAVMFIDLDGFKKVNDNHGHQIGDELLVQVGRRIGQCLRESDVVGRLGGDEFCLILPNIDIQDSSIKVAAKIIQSVNQPYSIKGTVVHVGASVGISLYPEHGADSETLLRKSDLSLYAVKQCGRNHCQVYKPEFEEILL